MAVRTPAGRRFHRRFELGDGPGQMHALGLAAGQARHQPRRMAGHVHLRQRRGGDGFAPPA